jgi:dipeptidyl aminopeptidase/acylaminoacyl peptidase
MTVSAQDFVAIGAATTPVFSADGQTLFHLRGAGLPQVWALDLRTGADHALTAHDERVAFLRRAPNDDRLIYGIDRGGDERQQLWLLDPATGAQRPLTDAPASIHDFGAFSPDGTRIAYAANDRDPAHFDIVIQALDGTAIRRVWQGSGLLSVGAFAPDGSLLTAIADRGFTDQSLLIVDPALGAATVFPRPVPTRYQSIRWAADGTGLCGLTDHGGADFLYLAAFDLATGLVETLFAAPGRDVEAWALSPDRARLATIENAGGASLLRLGPVNGPRPLVAGLPAGVISEPAFSPDGSLLAVAVSGPDIPPALWGIATATGAARPLWAPDPSRDFVVPTEVRWTSFDGREIPGFLALPAGPTPARGHPAIVWVHGGPEAQTRANFRPDIQALLARGFAVLMPNVRGSTGYGRDYFAADDRDKRLDATTDLAHAHAFLAAHPAIDATRIGIMGQSYGGYMVLSAITEHPALWRAAVNFYGIADFTTLLATTGPWRRAQRAYEYGDDPTLFARISPLRRAEQIRAPLLVLHGHRDPRVPITESEQIVAALRARQHRVDYLTFDDAGHGFIRPNDRVRAWDAVARFFHEHLC